MYFSVFTRICHNPNFLFFDPSKDEIDEHQELNSDVSVEEAAIDKITVEKIKQTLNLRTWVTDGLGFCYTLLVFGGLSAVCGALFVMKVEKRVQNELG